MKRWIFLLLICLIYFGTRSQSGHVTLNTTPSVPGISSEKPKVTPLLKRRPTSTSQKRVPSSSARTERLDLPAREIASTDIQIGNSFIVASNVKALPTDKYSPKFGPKISSDKHLTYFQPSQSIPDAQSVAYDKTTRTYHPISNIIHLKGISPEQRETFRSEGYKEFYYHKRMQLLSLETTSSQVLADYQTFKGRGLDARLEVIKEVHQTR